MSKPLFQASKATKPGKSQGKSLEKQENKTEGARAGVLGGDHSELAMPPKHSRGSKRHRRRRKRRRRKRRRRPKMPVADRVVKSLEGDESSAAADLYEKFETWDSAALQAFQGIE